LPTYEWVSSPDRNGEHTPIGYRPDRFEIVEGGGFGLAPDGKRSVAAWDAALPRTVTHATLRERSSKQQFTLYSVHLDHVGTEARRESARMILDRLPEGPVVVAGDFNCKPGSEPYEILTAELADAFEVAQIRAGPSETYTGFGDPTVDATDTPEAKRIDHALVRDISVHSHRTVSHNLDGFPPSDHRPVALEVSLQGDAPGSGS
jgi:endonuclease/exonuclease/phosphatase family metal-dependent hydrolase